MISVEVKHLPELHLAFVANLDGYNEQSIGKTWDRLCNWAETRDLITPETKYIGISIDNPDITPAHKCRYYACLTIPKDIPADQTVGLLDIAAGKHAVHRFVGLPDEFHATYQALYSQWLPQSGYQPADRPCYEIYYETPETNEYGKFVTDICLPLIPL